MFKNYSIKKKDTSSYSVLFNVAALLLSILSIVVTISIYYCSKQKKEITYYIFPNTYTIYQNDHLSPNIKLINDSTVINENIYALSGQVYNTGNIAINKSDIRKPLKIKFEGIKILHIELIASKLDSNFKTIQTSDNSFEVYWDYLDPSDGFLFYILYTGVKNPEAIVSGKIQDILSFRGVLLPSYEKRFESEHLKLTIIIYVLSAILFSVLVRYLWVKFSIRLTKLNKILIKILFVVILLCLLPFIYEIL